MGLQWDNIAVPLNVDDNFTMADTFVMLTVDSVIYGLITWYVDAVKPGDFGLPQPFYFPFTVCVKFCHRNEDSDSQLRSLLQVVMV